MVSCRICGRKAHNLGRHLRARHSDRLARGGPLIPLTSERYLERFPDAQVTSALYRRQVAGQRKPHLPPDPRFGTSAALSSHDGRIACGVCGRLYHNLGPHIRTHGVSAGDYRQQDGPLVSDANRDLHREMTRDLHDGIAWDEDAIVKTIRRWAHQHGGRPPTFRAWMRSRTTRERQFSTVGVEYPTATRVQQVFGSWNAGITAAGLEPRGRGGGGARKRCARGHRLTPDNLHVSATG